MLGTSRGSRRRKQRRSVVQDRERQRRRIVRPESGNRHLVPRRPSSGPSEIVPNRSRGERRRRQWAAFGQMLHRRPSAAGKSTQARIHNAGTAEFDRRSAGGENSQFYRSVATLYISSRNAFLQLLLGVRMRLE